MQKTLQIQGSEFVKGFITRNIKNEYIRKHLDHLGVVFLSRSQKVAVHNPESISEEQLCPSCKNLLVFSEGCSICIECGYSGCASG